MCTVLSFAISSRGRLVKFGAILMLVLLLEFAGPHICQLNQPPMPLKAKQPVGELQPCLLIKACFSARNFENILF